jgi:glutamyl-tRNA(Gln) amidotransferase subunit E
LFEILGRETNVSSTIIAVALTETLKAISREGVNVKVISDEQFRELFRLISMEKMVKESIPKILTWLAKNEGATVKDAIDSLGLAMFSRKEIEVLIDDVLNKNSKFIKQQGKNVFGPVMGIIMKKVRGRAKPNVINEILKDRLGKI